MLSNCLNQKVALHNIRVTCPMLSLYLCNTYREPSKLFIAGGYSLLSREGTTQGDPMAMPWYALSTIPIIDALRIFESKVLQVWLADDATAAGKLESLKRWYCELEAVGEKMGYYVNRGKCWLILKSNELSEYAKELFGETVNITVEGKRHLGACIGSASYKQKFCEKKVEGWTGELENLCEIAKTQPQAAYAAYTKGYRSKFTYFMRTIKNFEDFLLPIDTLLENDLLPAFFGDVCATISNHRDLLALNPSDGGLGINFVAKEAERQYSASKVMTCNHIESIIQQRSIMIETDTDGNMTDDIKKRNCPR